MKFRPALTFCGCFSLVAGVLLACAITLITGIFLICIGSSEERLDFVSMPVSPNAQVCMASWGFIGIILAVYGGMGAFFRIEANLKIFFWYQVPTLILGSSLPISFLTSGSLCKAIVDERIQRMGSSFACGFADTFAVMWLLILQLVHAYLVYIVWSAGEEIARNPYPELGRYQTALKSVKQPEQPGKNPLGPSRAIPGGLQHAGASMSPHILAPPSKGVVVSGPQQHHMPALPVPSVVTGPPLHHFAAGPPVVAANNTRDYHR
jgi:hypothetical protein